MRLETAFLNLLNSKKATVDQWRSFLQAAKQNDFVYRSAVESAHQILCDAVGAWIDSGLEPDNRENPKARTYLNWGNQLIFQHMEKLLDCFLTIPEKGVFGLQANQHGRRHPLYGQLAARIEPDGGFRLSPVLFNTSLPAEQLAALAFFIFWQSEWLHTLMRCAKCRTYSIARPKRKPYVRGWHCKLHRNSAAAAAKTDEVRKAFRAMWFSHAVEAFREYESHERRATGDPVAFITQRVNRDLPNRARITRKTITRNLKSIKAGKDQKTALHSSKTFGASLPHG